MGAFKDRPRRGETEGLRPVSRWLQAVTGHFFYLVAIQLLLGLSLLPALLCVWGFLGSRALIFVPGWILGGAAAGPFFTAVQRAAWEVQFGNTTYLYRSFFHWLRQSLAQGAALGAILAAAWSLLLSPALVLLTAGSRLPVWLGLYMAAGALVLCAAGEYAFYQAARWELPLWAVCKNAVLLLFACRWRSLAVGAIWLVLLGCLVLWTPIVLPVYVVLALPAAACITAQAVFAPQVDRLLEG